MIVIVGGGLAGLACATLLDKAGADWCLLEASGKPGGRVATEITGEGYRLDTGFQVLLDSYPTARRLLDLPALEPRYFESGALLVNERGESERFLNPLAHPDWILGALFSQAFSWWEKFSLSAHAAVQFFVPDQTLLRKETLHSTLEELRILGLDGPILNRFLRPFFAGVFLDNDLGTDSSIFRYNLKKFALGRALLPAGGMGKIPEQLASRLPASRVHFNARVVGFQRDGNRFISVESADGNLIPCDEIVLATDEMTTRSLLNLPPVSGDMEWNGVTTLYFIGDAPLYHGALLVLPEGRNPLVRHFVDLTNIVPEYAPPGKRLLSATILNAPEVSGDVVAATAQSEISTLFPAFADWRFLKEIKISRAIPTRPPGYGKSLLDNHQGGNLRLAGDQISPVGIESALLSGVRVAEELLGRA